MTREKKSETLDIRLSHTDKTALQDKAAREGRSVSSVIRDLIHDYLAAPEICNSNRLAEIIMTLKSKPKTVLASAAALIALPLTLAPYAAAETVALKFDAEYVQPWAENGVDGIRTRRFETEVHMETGESMTFNPTPDSHISITIALSESDNGLAIKMKIIDQTDSAAEMIAEPNFKARYGEATRIEMNSDEGRQFFLRVTPDKL